MEIPTDEVRRQLRASQADHRAGLRPWREALTRTFDRDSAAGASEKAALLGLPGRRQILRVGGLSILSATVLAACSDDSSEEGVVQSGQRLPTETTTTTLAPEEVAAVDLTLLRTAQSLEVLAIDVYQTALDSDLVTTTAVVDAARLFQEQHRDHAEAVEALIEDLDGTPYPEANPVLLEALTPTIGGLADEAGVVQLAADLEDVAAQTYALAGGAFSTTDLRAAATSIGATEARHLTVLRGVMEREPIPFAFMPTRNAVAEEAWLAEDDG